MLDGASVFEPGDERGKRAAFPRTNQLVRGSISQRRDRRQQPVLDVVGRDNALQPRDDHSPFQVFVGAHRAANLTPGAAWADPTSRGVRGSSGDHDRLRFPRSTVQRLHRLEANVGETSKERPRLLARKCREPHMDAALSVRHCVDLKLVVDRLRGQRGPSLPTSCETLLFMEVMSPEGEIGVHDVGRQGVRLTAMDFVFVSSIQRDFGDVREAARRAIESLGLRPLLAETAGAHVASPQGALLGLVARADVFLLILGPRYSKPTEDEFDEARRLAKPILVLRQEGDADSDQEEFVDRVAGGWQGGRLWGTFDDASDVGFAVVQALSNLSGQADLAAVRSQAEQRASALARGKQSSGVSGGSRARIAQVPLITGVLLDAVALDQPDLGERIAGLARKHRLVPQSIGIEPRISRAGVALHQISGYVNSAPLVEVGADGAIIATFDVAGDDQFGSMRVDPTRLEHGIKAAGAFARSVWDMIDEREKVQQVAAAVAISEAQHKVFGTATGRSSIQMGSFSMPNEVVVPEPPQVVRRAEVGGTDLVQRLVAEVRRAFADAGAVEK